MARVNTFLYDDTSTTLSLVYRRFNPATGLYYDNTKVTACSVEVREAATATNILLASTVMTYDANLGGWKYDWAFGSSLDGIDKIDIYYTPTRDVSVAAALAPDERHEMFTYKIRGGFNFNGFALNGII